MQLANIDNPIDINLNILECKCKLLLQILSFKWNINLNILECKCCNRSSSKSERSILI